MGHPYGRLSWGPASAAVGAERAAVSRPDPPSRSSTLSTSVSDIASELCRSSSSIGTFTPSPSSLSASSSSAFHPQNLNGLPARSPQPGLPPSQLPSTTFATYVSAMAIGPPSAMAQSSAAVPTPPPISSSSPSPSPPIPTIPRVVGPVTPARRSAHAPSQSQSQLHQATPQAPSSSQSKVSVAETPSGDLANFLLLKGSPLQSVVDFDTPTPSPRTPSVSPADQQAFALASHAGGSYLPLAADHRFLPGTSVSPSVARAQRAVATSAAVRSSFYCRICRVDPCHEITATACGHVFCNACIVEEVRENARCPVCNAAVLLFALLKLDIS